MLTLLFSKLLAASPADPATLVGDWDVAVARGDLWTCPELPLSPSSRWTIRVDPAGTYGVEVVGDRFLQRLAGVVIPDSHPLVLFMALRPSSAATPASTSMDTVNLTAGNVEGRLAAKGIVGWVHDPGACSATFTVIGSRSRH